MQPLLSIVLPTRNRQEYAIACIQHIHELFDERVQIVVPDNSDDDRLFKEIVQLGLKESVTYQYIPQRIPGVDNYAKGIELSKGEYVCLIGDDDGVNSCILDIVEWAYKHDISAIKSSTQVSFFWPGVYDGQMNGILELRPLTTMCRFANVKNGLCKLLDRGLQEYALCDVVRAYHGIVQRKYFEHIIQTTGRYVGGLSPDIYLAVALSLIIDTTICIDIPLTIAGGCRQSTTGGAVNHREIGKLEDAPHLIGQPYQWSDRVPRFYHGITIWADSAVHAFIEMGASEMLREMNMLKLYVRCLEKAPSFRREIYDSYKKNGQKYSELLQAEVAMRLCVLKDKAFTACWKLLKAIAPKKLIEWVRKKYIMSDVEIYQCEDISQAELIVRKHVAPVLSEVMVNLERLTIEKKR